MIMKILFPSKTMKMKQRKRITKRLFRKTTNLRLSHIMMNPKMIKRKKLRQKTKIQFKTKITAMKMTQ